MHHFFNVFDYVYVMKFIAGICFEFVEILNMFKLVEIADHFEVIIWLIVFFFFVYHFDSNYGNCFAPYHFE